MIIGNMYRRVFIRNLIISIPLTSLADRFLELNFLSNSSVILLSEKDKYIHLDIFKTYILPSHPIDQQYIEFSIAKNALMSDQLSFPNILSHRHTITGEKSPLIIDSHGTFRVGFEEKSQDWYVIVC